MQRSYKAWIAAAAIGVAGCEMVETESEVGADDQAVAGNGGTAVGSEPVSSEAGRFPEVVYIWANGAGCTGTIIGPHAVLTAAHCVDTVPTSTYVVSDSLGWLPATKVLHNPYLAPAWRPAWWRALDDAQKAAGGRQDDWPAQHDQVVLFVPALTPERIGALRMSVPQVDPSLPATDYDLVGVGSTGGSRRDYVPTAVVAAIANQITSSPRDGYLSRDSATVGYGTATPGDSGGPSVGSRSYLDYVYGGSREAGRFLLGTTQNPFDMAPLAYTPGMTANQRLTVRLNHLWLASAREDADGDDVPSACDADPSSPAVNTNLCPAPLGAPTTATKTFPTGLLACRDGYVPTGVFGRSGALIDQLGLRCRALSCFYGGGAGCDEYVTDAFGGDGGGAFQMTCPTGAAVTAVWGQHESYAVTTLGLGCTTFANLAAGSTSRSWTAKTGGNAGPSFYRPCDVGQVLTGFEARTTDARWVTGLQPICSSAPVRQTSYAGGQGGELHAHTCPVGTIAMGTVQRSANGWAIDELGLLCAPRSAVTAGSALTDQEVQVVQVGFRDAVSGTLYPERSVRYAQYRATRPWGSRETRCPRGYRASGVVFHSSWIVEGIDTLMCVPTAAAWGSSPAAVHVGVGGTGGAVGDATCGGREITGLVARNGWFLDGFALRCGN